MLIGEGFLPQLNQSAPGMFIPPLLQPVTLTNDMQVAVATTNDPREKEARMAIRLFFVRQEEMYRQRHWVTRYLPLNLSSLRSEIETRSSQGVPNALNPCA